MAKMLQTASAGTLTEVVDRILDKGLIIDAWVRLSLVGIELLAIEARIVVASVETYLTYAEAIGLTLPAPATAALPGAQQPATMTTTAAAVPVTA